MRLDAGSACCIRMLGYSIGTQFCVPMRTNKSMASHTLFCFSPFYNIVDRSKRMACGPKLHNDGVFSSPNIMEILCHSNHNYVKLEVAIDETLETNIIT